MHFLDTSRPANQGLWRIQAIGDYLSFMASDDAITLNTGIVNIWRSGKIQAPSIWINGGGTSPVSGNIFFGDGSGWQLIMGPSGVPAGGERFRFTDNGNLDLYGRLLAYGGHFPGRVTIGPSMGSGAGFQYSQFEVSSATGHPAMIWTDATMPVDQRKARIAYYGAKLEFSFLNDLENAHSGTQVFIDRTGSIATGGNLSASNITSGNTLTVNGLSTLIGQVNCNAISCSTITTNGNRISSGQIKVYGGANGNYDLAPLEIQMTANPRISFHWPGAVASQLGMDSAGTIRTFDNPGTGYATFAAGAIVGNGTMTVHGSINCWNVNTQGNNVTTQSLNSNLATIGAVSFNGEGPATMPNFRATSGAHMVLNAPAIYFNLDNQGGSCNYYGPQNFYGNIAAQSITCLNINTQGYNVTTGTLNVSGQVWVGASHSYGADNSASISTGPITSAAINCHGITCHAINAQGNNITGGTLTASTSGGISYTSHHYPLSDAGGHNLGNQLVRWSGIALALQPLAGGIQIMTNETGWLWYFSSTRATKRDIIPLSLEYAREVLDKIIPIRYRVAADVKQEDPLVAGWIVEDMVDAGLTELVANYNGKPASVQYERIAVYLTVVVKDMQRRINELEARLTPKESF